MSIRGHVWGSGPQNALEDCFDHPSSLYIPAKGDIAIPVGFPFSIQSTITPLNKHLFSEGFPRTTVISRSKYQMRLTTFGNNNCSTSATIKPSFFLNQIMSTWGTFKLSKKIWCKILYSHYCFKKLFIKKRKVLLYILFLNFCWQQLVTEAATEI